VGQTPLCTLQTGNLTPKAIIPVDLFGLPCDYDRINKTASGHNLVVIEDAAQSFGAEYKGRMAGSLAHAGCTSFFPAKPLGCYGDGGAILTDSDEMADTLKSIRIHGKGKDKYDNIRPELQESFRFIPQDPLPMFSKKVLTSPAI
jgi:UDP-2-acetamido-2-deoxy-ribo-hexuluronate aminotransferase